MPDTDFSPPASAHRLDRNDRDDLIHILNTRRSAIQHAADALWPWSDEANRPIRKTFALPLNRPLGMGHRPPLFQSKTHNHHLPIETRTKPRPPLVPRCRRLPA